MKNRSGHSGIILSDDDRALDEAAVTIVDALVETLEGEQTQEIEPFEQYTNQVRLHLLKDITNYAQRMIRGHLAIIREMKENK